MFRTDTQPTSLINLTDDPDAFIVRDPVKKYRPAAERLARCEPVKTELADFLA